MINGNPHEFIDHFCSGQDTVYLYRGRKFWAQGYTCRDKNEWRMEIFQYQPPSDGYIWEYESESVLKCMEAFLKAPIFNGKTFWEVESEIEWVDD